MTATLIGVLEEMALAYVLVLGLVLVLARTLGRSGGRRNKWLSIVDVSVVC